MSIFVDPTGEPTYGIGICGRCSRTFVLSKLRSDPNIPGLMVCEDDLDALDPYRLPARTPDQITLPFVRPDVRIEIPSGAHPAPPPPTPGIPYTVWASSFWADGLWADGFWA